MTEKSSLTKQKARSIRFRDSGLLIGCFCAFCLALILKNSDAAVEYVTRGLLLCAKVVIPSLFPFMVLSELIVSGGTVNQIPKPLLAPLRRLLGLPDAGVCAVLLGLLCGFPIGAKCVLSAYQKGFLSKDEAERALTCSSGPSSAFLIGAVGVSLWDNRRFGVALYLTVLAVSLLTGMLANGLQKKSLPSVAMPSPQWTTEESPMGRAAQFCNAVKSSLSGILLVCAYVVFFSALSGTFQLVLNEQSIPSGISAFLSCVLEISGGVGQASALGNAHIGAYLCAFAAGWSGISVHCQMLAVCENSALSLRPYFFSKLFQGLLCALIFGLLLSVFPELMLPAEFCGKS